MNKLERTINDYREGRISLAQAIRITDTYPFEFMDLVREQQVMVVKA